MNKIKMLISTFVIAVMLNGCSLTLPVTATSNPIGSKVGKSSATGFLEIFFFDADASIQTAAKNGGITKISTVDIKRKNTLGIIITYEVTVTGE